MPQCFICGKIVATAECRKVKNKYRCRIHSKMDKKIEKYLKNKKEGERR